MCQFPRCTSFVVARHGRSSFLVFNFIYVRFFFENTKTPQPHTYLNTRNRQKKSHCTRNQATIIMIMIYDHILLQIITYDINRIHYESIKSEILYFWQISSDHLYHRISFCTVFCFHPQPRVGWAWENHHFHFIYLFFGFNQYWLLVSINKI